MLIFLMISCTKKETAQRPMSQTDIVNCYQDMEWSRLGIRNTLIGNWRWIYNESYWSYGEGTNTENKNTLIELSNDSILTVFVDGEPKNTTRWTIEKNSGNSFFVELDSFVTTLLVGRILICGDIVEFNNSFVDGDDNYFQKIE